MKKLKLSIVLALVLTFALGMTASAEESTRSIVDIKGFYEGTATVDGVPKTVKIDEVEILTNKDIIEEVTQEKIAQLTGSQYEFNIFFEWIPIWSVDDNDYLLDAGSVTFDPAIKLTLQVDSVTANSVVKVIHYDNNIGWDNTPKVVAVRDGEIDVEFTSLSPIAILVKKDTATTSSSSSKKHKSNSSTTEETRWETPLSSGGNVSVNGTTAQLQIGPATKTLSEADAQALLGTTNSASVYLADLWLTDTATGAVITDGATITLNVPGVTAGSHVVVRHWLNGTDEFEDLVPTQVGNGYIVFRPSSMGQVAVCVDSAATGTAAAATTASGTSPKTAESSMIYVVEAMALVFLLGFAAFRKRSIDK
jgi:hypothetical protein